MLPLMTAENNKTRVLGTSNGITIALNFVKIAEMVWDLREEINSLVP
jgi:hypothetical protein